MSRLVSRRGVGLLAALILGVVVAFPLGVIASHQFGDVPDSNSYHNDIDALADSGVTSGCGGGNFCPSAFVTREQMAAFMNRLGALAAGKTPVVNAAKLGGLTKDQFARSDVAVTGSYTCPAEELRPSSPTVVWTLDNLNGIESGTDGARFICGVHLPDGAALIGVDFLVNDTSVSDNVPDCFMYTRSFTSGTLHMDGFGTGGTSGNGGVTTLSWLWEVGEQIVDNTAHSYLAGCYLDNSTETNIIEIEVKYSTTGDLVH